ncbi:hypothetical protein PHLCEN_2v774, partial [Hermanssonia centrifuga]
MGGAGERSSGDIDARLLLPFPVHYGISPSAGIVHYMGERPLDGLNELYSVNHVVAVEIPLGVLIEWVPYHALLDLTRSHKVVIDRRSRSKTAIIQRLQTHHCDLGCLPTVSVFHVGEPVGPLVPVQPRRLTDGAVHFPPRPLTAKAIASIVRDYCNSTSAYELSESPCAVCARLSLNKELTTYCVDSLNLSRLERSGIGVTRVERKHDTDPVCGIEGPVLYPGGIFDVNGERRLKICMKCHNAIKGNRLNRDALANGLWIGEVPQELQELNFVEKILVARYRHNVCVVRVDKGQRKMCANAVVFPQPVAKLCNVLPPPRADIDECLAVLFTGSCRPGEVEYSRTPLLVRHCKVMDALRWLQRNHVDYVDVEISEQNMSTYPEDEPPVSVFHRPTDGRLGGEMLAVYDSSEERGTETGPCPFAVHGLTGAELATMTYTAKIATAVEYFRSGGKVIAYGHGNEPASIYHNPSLYPGMFPWLFPYGLGGFENDSIATRLDRARHVRNLLLYADRRFQTDEYFPFIVYNQEQIRASTRGGYLLTGKRNFASVVDKILGVDREALQNLIDRGKDGRYLTPETEAERRCFELISLIDHVAQHVSGSTTMRKYQRNEIKSLIIAKGAPVWFITFAPADFKHPLCLYYCGERIDLNIFEGALPDYQHRMRLIANNPVACARFFHRVVTSFLRHILRSGSEDAGLFGQTETYYGTVESQGRLTLHLHLLLWIKSSISPQQIRDKLISDDDFRQEMIRWLEECHQGGFSHGSLEDVKERARTHRGYNPTECLPEGPPANMDEDAAQEWFHQVCDVTDHVLYLSNLHSSSHSKGCLRGKDPQCRARFPRTVRTETLVDWTSGALELKHSEEWLNTFNVVLTYLLRCNSDVTCLLSGTQVRAVIAYVTDYITKTSLTTHAVFETVKAVLDRNTALVNNQATRGDSARMLLTRIVNALTAMQESPGPMTCMYLLGQPDHYTPETFRVFYWSPYVREFTATAWQDEHVDPSDTSDAADRVVISHDGSGFVPRSQLNDYIYRPVELEDMTLYDYMASTSVRKLSDKQRSNQADDDVERTLEVEPDTGINNDEVDDIDDGERPETTSADKGTRILRFLPDHPLTSTHGVVLLKDTQKQCLNFVGKTLPRRDSGDREVYCKTMLALFSPGGWRQGKDIRPDANSWSSIYDGTLFSDEHHRIMKNMNLLYECLDAKHDFAAQRRAGLHDRLPVNFLSDAVLSGLEETTHEDVIVEQCTDEVLDVACVAGGVGERTAKDRAEMETMSAMLGSLVPQANFVLSHGIPNVSLPTQIGP